MVAEKIKYQVGKMVKSPFEMPEAEYKLWEEKCRKDAKDYLFSIGQPLVYLIDNKVVIEKSDGTIEYKNL